jgi:hypothetical protein
MALSGHKTPEVFRRYRALKVADLARAIEGREQYVAHHADERKVIALTAKLHNISHNRVSTGKKG